MYWSVFSIDPSVVLQGSKLICVKGLDRWFASRVILHQFILGVTCHSTSTQFIYTNLYFSDEVIGILFNIGEYLSVFDVWLEGIQTFNTMPTPTSAFPLIGNDLPNYCFIMSLLDTCGQADRIPPAEHVQSNVLTVLLVCSRKGSGESAKYKRTGLHTKVGAGLDTIVDLSEDNENGVFYLSFGPDIKFPGEGVLSDKSTKRQPRWFKFGKSCVVTFEEQLRISDADEGHNYWSRQKESSHFASIFLTVCFCVEKRILCHFYRRDEAGSQCYRHIHLQITAQDSFNMWQGVEMTQTRRETTCEKAFLVERLALIENNFSLVLTCFNITG